MSLLKMSQPMQVVTSSKTNEWYTPKEIIERVRTVLGSITLDPASHPIPQAWIQAEHYFTRADDGLSKPWFGRVFLNPPYGRGNAGRWAAKLIGEYRTGRVEQAILLVNTMLGYKWYADIWRSYPICITDERLRFIPPDGVIDGEAKQATTFFYFGRDASAFARAFEDVGRILFPDRVG